MKSDDILRRSPATGARSYRYGPAPSQVGDLWMPGGRGPFPVALVIHGGYWRSRYDRGYMSHCCAALRALGVACWSIEYRRLGETGGGWPGTFLDVARGADYLAELAPMHGLDLARVVACGHSAGGQLALWLAARKRVMDSIGLESLPAVELRAAVALGGVVDLVEAHRLQLSDGVVGELLGGSPDAVAERYAVTSPMALIPLGIPQVLVHGRADSAVPSSLSSSYAAAASLHDAVELWEPEGVGHFEPVDPQSTVFSRVCELLIGLF